MAKSKYEEQVQSRLEDVKRLAEGGHTDRQIAEELGVAYSTFRNYVKEHKDLAELLKVAKAVPDDNVETSLYKKATGYTRIVKKPVIIKDVEYENGKKVRETQKAIIVEEEQYFPPETAAICFYLKNRRKQRWTDNPHKTAIDKERLKLEKEKSEKDDF